MSGGEVHWYTWLNKLRRSWRYRLAYRLARPQAPKQPIPFRGPALIVGSAPASNLPDGFDSRFSVICVNGSQIVTADWGIDAPDVTFLQFNQVEGNGERATAVRRALSGKRCRILYVLRWPKSEARLREGLAAFDYGFDELRLINQYDRTRLAESVLGRVIAEGDNESKFSNGITSLLYAIHNGATAVIITGIDPSSTGHIYNALNMQRLHSDTDVKILIELLERGFRLYTSDPHVAESTGLPLWSKKELRE
ncbi:membrane-anchored protein [Pararhizobium sp. A13]|uniref:membrane-anchored protein n=1 Tax=Pararhizobium sp. A13 TaxID=3133975 RepID=UPI003253B186